MSAWFRCLVTGSRDWPDEAAVYAALDAVWTGAQGGGYDGLTVVHGAAKGADRMAYRWYRSRSRQDWAVAHEAHSAQWSEYGRRAGIVRNELMVRRGADVVLAFIAPCSDSKCRRSQPHGSHGATHCADLAEGAGIHVQRFEPADLLARADAGPLPNPERR